MSTHKPSGARAVLKPTLLSSATRLIAGLPVSARARGQDPHPRPCSSPVAITPPALPRARAPRLCSAEKLAERTEAAEITQKLLQAAAKAPQTGGKIINAYGQEEVGISRREARQGQLRSMYSQSTEKVRCLAACLGARGVWHATRLCLRQQRDAGAMHRLWWRRRGSRRRTATRPTCPDPFLRASTKWANVGGSRPRCPRK